MVNLIIINNRDELSVNKYIKDTVVCYPNNFCAYYDSNGKIHNIEDYIVVDKIENLSTYTSTTALYIVIDKNMLYRLIGGAYKECITPEMAINGDTSTLFKKTILYDDAIGDIAPVTLSSSVVLRDNSSLENMMNKIGDSILCKTVVETKIVMANRMNQTVFKIPYPFLDYLLGYNVMTVIVNNVPLSNKNYIVDGDYLRLIDMSINLNNYILFIFSYNQIIDQNMIMVNSNNIKNGSIKSQHLAGDIQYPATNILTNDEMQFISKEEKESFANKAEKDIVTTDENGLMSNSMYRDLITLKSQVKALMEKKQPTILSGTSIIYKDTSVTYIQNPFITKEMSAFANVLTDDDGDKYNCNLTLECFDGKLVVSIDTVPNVDVYFNWCVIQQAIDE